MPHKSAFLFSFFNPEDVEDLGDLRGRREQCSLCLMNGISIDNKNYDSKILAVGGYKNQCTGDYQQTCEIVDLQIGIWKSTAKLQMDRLSPHVVSLGNDSALVIGGKQVDGKEKLILQAEIIDTKSKKSYFPKSGFKLPGDLSEIFGLFKLSQEIEHARVKSRDPETGYVEYFFQPAIESTQDHIRVLVEKVILLYLNKKHQLCSLFLDCESIIVEKVLTEQTNFDSLQNKEASSGASESSSQVTEQAIATGKFDVKVNP
jgi:hypothetical protein